MYLILLCILPSVISNFFDISMRPLVRTTIAGNKCNLALFVHMTGIFLHFKLTSLDSFRKPTQILSIKTAGSSENSRRSKSSITFSNAMPRKWTWHAVLMRTQVNILTWKRLFGPNKIYVWNHLFREVEEKLSSYWLCYSRNLKSYNAPFPNRYARLCGTTICRKRILSCLICSQDR